MPITVNYRKMLHRKSPEYCAPLGAGATIVGGFADADKSEIVPGHDTVYYVGGVSAIWNYNADEDGWLQIPNSGIAGTFGAGACGEFNPLSAPSGAITNTATAGTTTTVTTALNLARTLAGCTFIVVAGTGVGYSGTIKSNTIGANAIITLNTANGVAFDATTQFRFFAGSLWFFNSGAGVVGFAVYDRATNVWTQRSVVGLPTTFGTEGQLVSTSSLASNRGLGFVNATATAGAASTLTDSAKTWPVNGWANYQVRIISGTGLGQIRTIASNTATALTTSAAWAVNPDATSVYRIEGNDDFLYLLGNAAVTMYRFSISGNTWTTLAPVAARAAAPGAGMTADWIDGVGDAQWTDGLYSNLNAAGTMQRHNGRFIYSFRGAAGAVLDVYDIAANTWISAHPYGNQLETLTTGSCSFELDGSIYIQKDATGRILRFDVAKNVIDPFTINPVPQGAAVAGDKMFATTLKDGATTIRYVYTLGHTRSELTRWLVV
jgi:hypothetical protein